MSTQQNVLKIWIPFFAILVGACIDSRPPKITKALEGSMDIPARQGFINDYAGIIDAATKQKLESDLSTFKQRANVDFVIVIVEFEGGYSINDHSMEIVRQWCLDCRSETGGEILIDIAMQDQEFRLNVSKPLWRALPDEELDQLKALLEQSFSNGEYSTGLSEIVREVTNRVLARHDRTNSNA